MAVWTAFSSLNKWLLWDNLNAASTNAPQVWEKTDAAILLISSINEAFH